MAIWESRTVKPHRIPDELKFNKAIIEGFTIWPTAITNGFSYPETPVITDVEPNIIQPFHWGLIPFWAKDDKIRSMTLNAKIETLHKNLRSEIRLTNAG